MPRENPLGGHIIQEAAGIVEQATGKRPEAVTVEHKDGTETVEWEIDGDEPGTKVLFRLEVDPVSYDVLQRTWIEKKGGKETLIKYENAEKLGGLASLEHQLIENEQRKLSERKPS
jgi:hypothetical protein